MTDAQIIALFWARNEDAIHETDAAYGRKLYAISDKILHSSQDAEESVSDTYMRAWDNCLTEFSVVTEDGTRYGVNLSEAFARCDDGQAALTEEQIERIRQILDNQT